MKTHNLKTDPEVFSASLIGLKPWEIRYDDRGYQVGDMIILEETKYSRYEMRRGKPLEYTGRKLSLLITYILPVRTYGSEDGLVVMTVSNI